MSHRTQPLEIKTMPPGVPHIIGNEAAERFSFYGMKAVLAVFFTNYLFLMDGEIGTPMSETKSTELVHLFNFAFYVTPIIGAILADAFLGKYKVIILLSLVYCAGHASLALMGTFGNSEYLMYLGMGLIALGAGGIKPCVSAHVGDQFGSKNAHFLPRIFNWFYFSINLGAFASILLTPWLMEWYGPHWAFGVPGILMALATFIFWLGRKRFAHVPPGGIGFLKEIFSKEGITVLLKLTPVYLFVAIFWALFDQTGSTWIFQSQDMDRNFLGFNWLPSQIQSLNSVFVLSFIPIFSYFIYPFFEKFWPLSSMRKMAIGFLLMTVAFVLVSLIQENIDAGGRPNIVWQIAAFALLTASEIMISIVALEFAYTQSPRKMKSFVMCFYLAAVAIGNLLVAGVNHYIRIPSAAEEQLTAAIEKLPEDWQESPRFAALPGYDGKTGTPDDFIIRLKNGKQMSLELPGQETIDEAAAAITAAASNGLPDEQTGKELLSGFLDHWQRPFRYIILNSTTARIWSAGADGEWNTKWDIGLTIEKPEPDPVSKPSWADKLRPEEPWLETRKKELNYTKETSGGAGESFKKDTFSGGQVRLQGAAYFWFFSALMAITALIFIPFAYFYKTKSYLQTE
ncbi:MAG: POT family MFS transporter [Luteolibacter sp.]